MAGVKTSSARFRERPARFGTHRSLAGIVSLPEARPDPLPTVVIFNAGVVHRVGPSRLTVRMAREMAAQGFSALRFDFSGLGDSDPRPDAASLDASVAADVAEALDYLSDKHGMERCVLVGLCSGGREALRGALADSRVVGAMIIDAFIFKTRGFVMRHIGRRLLRPSSWKTALTSRDRDLATLLGFGDPAAGERGVVCTPGRLPEAPTREQMRDALTDALGRGVELLVVHTGGLPHEYNYEGQFREAFPVAFADPRLTYAYLSGADHTFTREADRTRLLEVMGAWVSRWI